MKISQWFWLVVMLVFSDACVEPLDVPVIRTGRKLVVDGMISDAPGPYQVKLFMSPYQDEDETLLQHISGAVVKIIDDQSNEAILAEESPGVYVTDSELQGEGGRTYQLDIRTVDGKHYQSSVEEINPSGSVDKVYFEYHENDINHDDLTKPQDALWIYIDAKGADAGKNLIRWRWQGTFFTHTYPELRTKKVRELTLPNPMGCSGFIAQGETIVKVSECVCCDCWSPLYNSNVILSPSEFSSQPKFDRVLVGKMPVDKHYFSDKFHIQVEQLSLTETIYDFWALVAKTKEGSENIFQPNVVKVKGNIRCMSDESEEVFGVFSAASIVHNDRFVYRGDFPKAIPKMDSLIEDCRELFPGASNQRPPFW